MNSMKRCPGAKSPLFFRALAVCLVAGISLFWLSSCVAQQPGVEVVEEESMTTQGAAQASGAQNTSTTVQSASSESSTPRSPYDGLEIGPEFVGKRPLAVMVDNVVTARMQAGLSQASAVYEITDEGGITRFVAIFGPDREVSIIGPVRSARPYYAEVAFSFDALFAHFGGSDQGYETINYLGIPSLDAIRAGAPFWRDSSRPAPSNAFMKTSDLLAFAEKKGYTLEGGRSPFKFKDDAPEADRGQADSITVDYSSPAYAAGFEYDRASNSYKKFVGGSVHVDASTGEQLVVKNIVVQVTDIANTGDKEGHMAVRTVGEGKAFYFMDGKVIKGIWRHESLDAPFSYLDSDGNEVQFNRGLTWVGFLPDESRLKSTSLGEM